MAMLLQIRNVPEETHRTLKARAAARGTSLNSYLLELVAREAARPSVAEVLERAARRSGRAEASALPALAKERSAREKQAAKQRGA